jgi:putative transposase
MPVGPTRSSRRSGAGAYPAIKTLWDNAWEEFMPFLDYDVEIRKVLCSTNAIESLNARNRPAVRAGGTSPTSRPR